MSLCVSTDHPKALPTDPLMEPQMASMDTVSFILNACSAYNYISHMRHFDTDTNTGRVLKNVNGRYFIVVRAAERKVKPVQIMGAYFSLKTRLLSGFSLFLIK